jgi:hypothetical protein
VSKKRVKEQESKRGRRCKKEDQKPQPLIPFSTHVERGTQGER